jgi:hypothetical protein
MVPVDHQAVSGLYGKAAGARLKRGLAGFAAPLAPGRGKWRGGRLDALDVFSFSSAFYADLPYFHSQNAAQRRIQPTKFKDEKPPSVSYSMSYFHPFQCPRFHKSIDSIE